jgi:hypothetical protein
MRKLITVLIISFIFINCLSTEYQQIEPKAPPPKESADSQYRRLARYEGYQQTDNRYDVSCNVRAGSLYVRFYGIGYEFEKGFDVDTTTKNTLYITITSSTNFDVANPIYSYYRITDANGAVLYNGKGKDIFPKVKQTNNFKFLCYATDIVILNDKLQYPLTVETIHYYNTDKSTFIISEN